MKIKREKEKGESGFISGVLILSVSTFIVKLIGLAYKIPMIALLGAEGMGYFNSAYEIYALLCVISTAGLPVALSMLISACHERGSVREAGRVYRSAMAVFAVLGGVGCAFMLLFSGQLARLIESPDAAASVAAIAPALLFVCISSAVRGYFQGLCKMAPTAISQLIEALGKLILGVLFANLALGAGYGIPTAAAFAILGISIGAMLSALYLLLAKAIHNRKERGLALSTRENAENARSKAVSNLFRIAIPITLSSAALSLTRITDMALIMRRLQDIGYSAAGANAIYGSYTTLAVPMFGLIPSLITPVALALVPRLSAAIERGSDAGQSSVAGSAMRITVFFAMPASFGVAIYSEPILKLLFSGETEAIAVAAPLLSVLGISILFSCIITTTNAILQSYRQTAKPIISVAVGAAVKIASAYILIGIPSVGVWGAPISTLLCDITVTAINLYFINKSLPRTESVMSVYARPFCASVAMITVSYAVYMAVGFFGGNTVMSFGLALISAIVSYFLFAFVFGAVRESDMLMLPAGGRALEIVRKTGLIRP
ncbi:MAG: polysaccharide biosynthesis protein [Clostridia bacterium]|nr:polysaccharide biosynthesis protein [Clostridia bacterium]